MNKRGSGDWFPLYLSLIILFLLGGLIPLIIQGFVSEGIYDESSFIAPLINVVDNGFTIADITLFGWNIWDGINFNPFDWFGADFNSFIINQISAFTFIPNYISIPLLIICILGLIYTLIKLLPTT